MSNVTKLNPEHTLARQLIANHHNIQPTDASAITHSQCSDCGSAQIAWVATEAYLSLLADKEAPQHVLEDPDGQAWICLECEGTGYIGSQPLADTKTIVQIASEVTFFNDSMLISKIPSSVMNDDDKKLLNDLLVEVHASGLHKDYDLFFELAKDFNDREYALAGSAMSRELKVNEDNPVVARNMVTLALIAAPIVSAFAPAASASIQMPLIVKRLGRELTSRWRSDDLQLLDKPRLNFARGVLIRMITNHDEVAGSGYHEDIFTQWVGEHHSALVEHAEEVRESGGVTLDLMARWVGKKEALRFLSNTEAVEVTSLTSSVELGYLVEEIELIKGKASGVSVDYRNVDDTGKYVFNLAQLGYLESYAALQGHAGHKSQLPVYQLVTALDVPGVKEGGEGLAEEIILAFTCIDQELMEPIVEAVFELDEFQKIKVTEELDDLINYIHWQEITSERMVSLLRESIGISTEVGVAS